MMKMDVLEVLKNGVRVYDLADFAEEDFNEAQNILDSGDATNVIHAESQYNVRVVNEFVGVYEVDIDSVEEYNRFAMMLQNEVDMERLSVFPSIEEWKEGKLTDEHGRKVSLVKWMRKKGASSELVDFYTAQVRTGKERVYLTISDLPQHIAGMSYYHAPNTGSLETSCQNVDCAESVHLAGSLHDNKLFVAMLHKDIEDLEDMEGKLLARVNMRYVDIAGYEMLIPSRYYGSEKTRAKLDRALKMLEEKGIMSRDIREADDEDINWKLLKEPANGYASIYMTDYIHIEETIEETVETECPMCEGSGEYEIFSPALEKDVEVKCPACNGHGEVYANVYIEVDEFKEIEEEMETTTYTDDYEHFGYNVVIGVSPSRLERHLRAFGE